METIHLHHDSQNSHLNTILLLIPSLVFALIIFSYFFLKGKSNSSPVATEANPALGSEINSLNYSVLGDQDSIDSSTSQSLE